MIRLLLIAFGIASAAVAPAQDFPNRPVRMISPNPPSGANDTIGRIIAAKLGEVLRQPMVVDNRGGAGGTLGAEIAAQANADGYTLLAASVSTHSFSPALKSKLNYDPVRDFAPISLFAISQNLLVTNPSLRTATVKDLVALAKAKPGALNYASGGTGSTSHYAIALFVHRAGIAKDTVHIPYKGGAPSVAATMAGETQFYFGPMASMTAQVRAGKLKALAAGGIKRSTLPALRPNRPIPPGCVQNRHWLRCLICQMSCPYSRYGPRQAPCH